MRTIRVTAVKVAVAAALAMVVVAGSSSAVASATESASPRSAAENTEIVPREASSKGGGKSKPKDSTFSAMAAGCYGTSCTGQNPSTMGCGVDSRTLEEFTLGQFRVELRHSNTCWAAWTRITTRSTAAPDDCNTAFGQIRGYDLSTDARKGVHGVQAACPGVQSRNTAMWTYTDGVRACYSYQWYDGEPAACTKRR